jgi:hypothetical protein
MQRRHTAILIAVLALPLVAGGDRPQNITDARSSAVSGAFDAAPPALAAGQVISIDPATGKTRGIAAQESDLREILGDAISTSSEGLAEKKNPIAGGGYMLDLQGRFQNAMTAVLDANASP